MKIAAQSRMKYLTSFITLAECEVLSTTKICSQKQLSIILQSMLVSRICRSCAGRFTVIYIIVLLDNMHSHLLNSIDFTFGNQQR